MKTFESNYNLCSFKKVISLRRNIQLQSCIVPHYNCHVQNSSKSFSRQKNPKAIKTRDEKKFSNIMGDDFFLFFNLYFLGKTVLYSRVILAHLKTNSIVRILSLSPDKKGDKKEKKSNPDFYLQLFLKWPFYCRRKCLRQPLPYCRIICQPQSLKAK